MDSRKSIVFFAFIVTANCYYLEDNITDTFVNNCHGPKSLLEPLKLEFCKTSGDRGSNDILCNGIYSIIRDICVNSSTLKLDQVIKNSSMFTSDNPVKFCEEVGSLNIVLNNVPINVSKNLEKMKNPGACSAICTLLDNGKVNPLCTFLVSFSVLKNKTDVVQKAGNVLNTAAGKHPISIPVAEKNQNTAPQNQNVPNDSELPHEDSTVDMKSNKLPKVPLQPDATKSNSNVPTKQSASDIHPPNDDPSDRDDGSSVIKGSPGGEFPPPDGEISQPEVSPGISRDENHDPVPDQPDNTNDENIEANDNHEAHAVENSNDGNTFQHSSNEDQKLELGPQDRIKTDPFENAGDSNFFTYFIFISAICVCFYIAMYNKKKILALMIEGRRSSVKRRPNSAAYSKLDCTLEEAMASGPSTSSSNTLLY